MGALPHFAIEWQTNGNTLFQGAWDEDFYILTLFGKIPEWNNYPIRNILQSTIKILHLNIPNVVFLFDVIFPFITVVVAGQIAMLLLSSTYSSLLLTFSLVFGSEIFSLNSSLFTIPLIDLKQLISSMEVANKQYFLDTYSTFFSIYRTPEPQLSYVIFLYFIKTLIKFYQHSGSDKSINIPFYVLSIVSTFTYPFFAIASVGLNIICIVCVAIEKNYDLFRRLLPIVFSSSIMILFIINLYYSKEANATVFQNRLPLFSISVVYSFIFALIIIVLKVTKFIAFKNIRLFPYLALMFPAIILNQQIFTGHAVQAINWERYVNIPVLTLSIILVIKQIKVNTNLKVYGFGEFDWLKYIKALPRLSNILIILIIALFLGSSQLNNYRQWLYYNILTETYGLALKDYHLDDLPHETNIILKDMSASSAIIVRSSFQYSTIKGYDWIISNGFGSSKNNKKIMSEAGFEFASRLGLNAEQYKKALIKELDGNYCWPHLMYIASFLECAPYVSDFRNYNKDKLIKIIENNVTQYNAYLNNHPRQAGYLFSTQKFDNTADNYLWENTLISQKTLNLRDIPGISTPKITVFTYRQEPRL